MSAIVLWAASVVVNRLLSDMETIEQQEAEESRRAEERKNWVENLQPGKLAPIGAKVPTVFGAKIVPCRLVKQTAAETLAGLAIGDAPVWRRSGLYIFADSVDGVRMFYQKAEEAKGVLLPLGDNLYREREVLAEVGHEPGVGREPSEAYNRRPLFFEIDPTDGTFSGRYGHFPKVRTVGVSLGNKSVANRNITTYEDTDFDGVNDQVVEVKGVSIAQSTSTSFTIFPQGMLGGSALPTKPFISYRWQGDKEGTLTNQDGTYIFVQEDYSTSKHYYPETSWSVNAPEAGDSEEEYQARDTNAYEELACINIASVNKVGEGGGYTSDSGYYVLAERRSVTGLIGSDSRALDSFQLEQKVVFSLLEGYIAYPGDLIGANPAIVMAEILTNTVWGMGTPSSELDIDSFVEAASILYTENIFINTAVADGKYETVLDECANVAESIIYVNRSNGLITLALLREDQWVDKEFDDDTISSVDTVTATRSDEVPKSVAVRYSDDASMDMVTYVNSNSIGSMSDLVLDMPYINDSSVADTVLVRNTRLMTAKSVRATIKVPSGSASDVNPGDVVKFGSLTLGIPTGQYRVLGVTDSKADSGDVTLTLVTDTWGNAATPYYVRTEERLNSISSYALPTPSAEAQGATYLEMSNRLGEITDVNSMVTRPFISVMAASPSANHSHFKVPGFSPPINSAKSRFALWGNLANAILPSDNSIAVNGLGFLPQFESIMYIGAEMVQVYGYSEDSAGGTSILVRRGCHDTVPVNHPADVRVMQLMLPNNTGIYWMSNLAPVPPVQPPSEYKVITELFSGEVLSSTEAQYYQWNPAEGNRSTKPPTPVNVRVNGTSYPNVISGDVSITWNHRQHTDDFKSLKPKHFLSLDGTSGGNFYQVTFVMDSGAFTDTTTALGYVVLEANLIAANGGTAPTFIDLTIEGINPSNGSLSWQKYEYSITYGTGAGQGWGFDWGNTWGI